MGYPSDLRRIALINGSDETIGQPYNPHDQILSWFHNTAALKLKTYVWAVPDGTMGNTLTAEASAESFFSLLGLVIRQSSSSTVLHVDGIAGNMNPYDNAPGGAEPTQWSVAQAFSGVFQPATNPGDRYYHCFVPSVSGLDIAAPYSDNLFYDIAGGSIVATGKTPFEAYYAAGFNNERHIQDFNWGNLDDIIEHEMMPDNMYLQDRTMINGEVVDFEARTRIYSGSNVTARRASGDFVVSSGADVEFRAGTEIVLGDGFRAMSGSLFHAHIQTMPVCTPPAPMAATENAGAKVAHGQGRGRTEESVTHLAAYPNPARNSVLIHYQARAERVLSLEIINLYGQTVATLIDKFQHLAGRYTMQFDASALPAGTYYCVLRNGEYVESIPVIITH